MSQRIVSIICVMFFFMRVAHAQTSHAPAANQNPPTNTKEKKVLGNKMFNFDIMASMDFPEADMAKRFGTSYRLGLGIKYKSEKNWIVGIKGELMMGNKIKEDSLMINLRTSQGGVISQLGDVLNVGTFERGYLIGAQLGKIFPYFQLNKNSGPTTIFSVGFMQHKIKLFDKDNSFPQLRDGYVKGYDRLTNGLFIEDFIGYSYYSTNKLINVYAGFNAVWGFTKGRRDFLYDVARSDSKSRNDVLLGFKFGWVIPIYRKLSEETYY